MTDPLLYLEEFFAPAEVAQLQRYLIDREPDFIASEVISDGEEGRRHEDFRRSRVLFDVADVYPVIAERVLAYFPYVMDRLHQAMFEVREIELQLTASNDGEWFKPHRDSGHGPVRSRELTFVYYCHREPRAFAGGELLMFGPYDDASDPRAQERCISLSPAQNSIVFFPSHYLHEVRPVSCPSRQFAASRLTYNGWLHR